MAANGVTCGEENYKKIDGEGRKCRNMINFAADKSETTSETGAEIAQSVEHFTRNEKVSGSSPDFGSHYQAVAKSDCFFICKKTPKNGRFEPICLPQCLPQNRHSASGHNTIN